MGYLTRVSDMRRIRPAEYRLMPWKNGLGTTTEIAVHPPGAPLDAFEWRLSIAELAASGPFSTFPGYDRILVQIEGAPMTLRHEGGGEQRLRLLEPYRFAGELSTYGELEAPSARDFNVMVRRDRASAEVSVRELARAAPLRADTEAEVSIVHALHGEVSVEVDGESIPLSARESLVVRGAPRLAVTAALTGATVILIAVGPPGLRMAPP